jgi:hypothetical protein
VARVPCYGAVYDDARQAASAVLDLVRPVDGALASYRVVLSETPAGTASQPFPAADLNALCFEDGALLVREHSGEFVTVDLVGAVIWPLLDGHRTVESIGAELAPLFGAPRMEIESDISRWISDLVDRGFLITPSDVNESGERAAPR